ncbi:MAG: hypothetical protein Q9165_007279 [Trypethelium subeluteriae]
MYSWLNGPGQVFHDPLPNSTNYLNAYDKAGRLIRAKDTDEKAKSNSEQDKVEAENDGDPDAQEASSEEAGAARLRREARRQDQESRGDENKVPTESMEDLRPFPQNAQFMSQPVLSVELRDEIFRRVKGEGLDVRTVSAQLGVAIERVGAVVRLKTVEEEWIKQGKKRATPYQTAILSMLPTTPFDPLSRSRTSDSSRSRPLPLAHEPINDLPVHPATRPQLFVPVSESRVFTRDDAAAAFSATLLPAHARIPHPQLVLAERYRASGMTDPEVRVRMKEEEREREEREREKEERRREAEGRRMRVVQGRRWDFRFEDVRVEDVGRDGLSERGVGWRYGAPHDDRKRGKVKIPTRVG